MVWVVLRRQMFQFSRLFLVRHGKICYFSVQKEFSRAQPIFCNDRITLKRFPKDFRCIFDDLLITVLGSHRRGCSDTAEKSIIDSKTAFQSSKKAGKVCSLRSIECMKFIDRNILQCLRAIVLPELGIFRTHQKIIQHLIVRHQDVRRTV